MGSGLFHVYLNRLCVLSNVTEATAREYAEDLVLQVARLYSQPKRRIKAETAAAQIRSGRLDQVEISAWLVLVIPREVRP